jgi:hypothetical protein
LVRRRSWEGAQGNFLGDGKVLHTDCGSGSELSMIYTYWNCSLNVDILFLCKLCFNKIDSKKRVHCLEKTTMKANPNLQDH